VTEVSRPGGRAFVARPAAALRRRLPRGALRRPLTDPYMAEAAALLVPVYLVALAQADRLLLVSGIALAFVGVQLAFSLRAPERGSAASSAAWSELRLLVSLLFVAGAQLALPEHSGLLALVYVPVVGLAATIGQSQAIATGVAAVAAHAGAELLQRSPDGDWLVRALAFAAVVFVVALFVRVEVARLRHARDGLRLAVRMDRRRARHIAGVEAIGHLLATSGPTRETLRAAVDRISSELGYQHVAVFIAEGSGMRLGAQHGYREVAERLEGDRGVSGRVMRTRRAELIANVTADPDYWAIHDDVRSEICAPMLADGELLGIINVESTDATPLDTTDLRVIVSIADRLAAALTIARERAQLSERAELFRSLHEFSEAINGTLEEEELYRAIVRSISSVVPSDIAALSILDRASSRYLLRATHGYDNVALGIEVRVGEGMAGRAIRDRTLIIDPSYSEPNYPASVADHEPGQPLLAAAVPLIRDRAAIGALTVLRRDRTRSFTLLERDALAMLAEQASLAVANVFLHADVAELAIRDPLTGLFNRRYFDPALEQLFAQRSRIPRGERPPLAAIIFDLDHFSDFNNAWGHQAGDAVLRTFASVLRGRLRATDLVARFGGEEFVAVLYRATLEDAMRVAEEVRAQIAATPIDGIAEQTLYATVSAGCSGASDEANTPEALLRAADVALYMAKRAGRDRVVAA
jgi:diguanylate cyclase (GGDEF)-like protein